MNEELTEIQNLYNIPEVIELIFPSPYQTTDIHPDCVSIHALSIVYGLCFPFHHFFDELLNEYRLASTKLRCNNWLKSWEENLALKDKEMGLFWEKVELQGLTLPELLSKVEAPKKELSSFKDSEEGK
ncbi:hypothetical protein Adt_27411 [Abeliophyllum distichum]|uniref:Uncharacterized protein n=1 Tax=Abeliophyllum distichum TaxID=126358 RepID=A0ABD1RVN9_9LAMI